MSEPLQNSGTIKSPRLQRFLFPVAQKLRQSKALRRRTRYLTKAILASLFGVLISWLFPSFAGVVSILILLGFVVVLLLAWQKDLNEPLDYLEAARKVEADFPELNASLVTAVELELLHDNSFLSRRVTNQALETPSRENWERVGTKPLSRSRLQYLATMSLAILPLVACYFFADQSYKPLFDAPRLSASDSLSIELLPGDVEIEKGSSLVVTARFGGDVPDSVSLVTVSDSGVETSTVMARSLSDPVFAYSLRYIEEGLNYRVSYQDAQSHEARIDVFELPELLTANASMTFPEYTNWEPRSVEDTLRVSAIEGTELRYEFNFNKPVDRAYLESPSGALFNLTASNDQKTQFALDETLQKSDTFRLRLIDLEGRENSFPPEIRIDTIKNLRPELRVETPRGDQRFTAIQEVLFEGNASDDFGLLDYGIGFVHSDSNIDERSLQSEPAISDDAFQATIRELLTLESYNLEPKDSLSWYLWADDYGPKGDVRRSTSDLYFADIRAFDEIFREQDGGGGAGQGAAADQGMELLEKQQRIAISIFRIKNSATQATEVVDDLDVVRQSQVEALSALEQLIPQIESAEAREAAMDAQRSMQGADLGLTNAVDEPTLEPLEYAWLDAQSAYQSLVKLTEDEFNISRSRSQGGGGNPSRSQSQINELDFRQEENRYETATEAQPLQSPDERKDLQLISKLNDLSRRQDDMNERLQDMQSALALATSDEEREQIERELKRLQEEQRQLLDAADEAIQQSGNRQSAREARRQLESVRENMQQASEQLDQGEVSQALASGTRAQDTLERTKEELRSQNSSQFSEAMREARNRADEIAESQKTLQEELQEFEQSNRPSLDDSEQRSSLSEKIDQQAEAVESFLEDLQEIASNAESVEPKLFRDLYQVLRDSAGSDFEVRYQSSSTLLDKGFVDDARDTQRGLAEDLEAMSEAVASAAQGVLGDEGATLEFAQSEIESLRDQLEAERENNSQSNPSSSQSNPSSSQANPSSQQSSSQPSSASSGSPSSGGGSSSSSQPSIEEMVRNALADLQSGSAGPLTGSGFEDWVDRLSTVESLINEPLTRSRVTEARETAESMRRDFRRRGELPQWEIVENEIAAPLNEVSSWLETELRRIENPDALQRIDRDPVPDDYTESVQRYYETLGN